MRKTVKKAGGGGVSSGSGGAKYPRIVAAAGGKNAPAEAKMIHRKVVRRQEAGKPIGKGLGSVARGMVKDLGFSRSDFKSAAPVAKAMGGSIAPKGGGIAQKPFKGPRPSPVGSGGGMTRPSMPGKNNPVMTRAKGGTVKKAMGGAASTGSSALNLPGGTYAPPPPQEAIPKSIPYSSGPLVASNSSGGGRGRQAMRPSINSMRPGGVGVPRPAPGGGMTKPVAPGSKTMANGNRPGGGGGSGASPTGPRPAPGGGMTKPSVPGKKPMKKEKPMKMGRGFPGGPPIKPPKKKV